MTSTQHDATTTTPTTSWTIDPAHTAVEFAVKHMMITTVKGRFAAVQGTVEIDETDVTGSQVDVTIETASIDTREEKRDAHLRSADFFDVERFPQIRFVSREVEEGAKGLRLIGDLTIRGITREIVLDVEDSGRGTDPWGGERAAFTATGKLNRLDYGLKWNQALETGGVLVANDVRITLDVQLIRA
jgi:polyisoprenoid-binding protein YceI